MSNGTAGASEVDHGKQYSAQLYHVQSIWRLGVAANYNDAAVGAKSSYGLFGGVRTGPIAWLAEADLIDDKSFPNDTGKATTGLIEANWLIKQGHNLKITGEYYDPNRNVSNDQRTRWSLVYEYTPIQFLQLRGGVRYSDGIPQLESEHTRIYFIQLHGYF